MPRIEIMNGHEQPDPPLSRVSSAFGTTVKIDGQRLDDVRSVTLRCEAGEVIRADVEVFVYTPLAVNLLADVHVHFVAPPDYQLIETTSLTDAGERIKRYVVSRIAT